MSIDAEQNNNNRQRNHFSAIRKIVILGVSLIGTALAYNYVNDLSTVGATIQKTVSAPNAKPAPLAASPAPMQPPGVPSARQTVEIETELGKLEIELFSDKAPAAVAELINLVNSGYFNSDTVLETRPGLGLVIAKIGEAAKSYHVKDELNSLTSQRGSVAITKLSVADAYLNNIFIGFQSQPELEKKYIIIGQVTKGLEAIERSAPGVTRTVNGFKLNVTGQKQPLQAAGVQGE